MKGRLVLLVSCTILAVAASPARAATLTVPGVITVSGTDVFAGPTFTVMGNYGLADAFAVTADGEIGLAVTSFFANAAGIITRPDPTNTGHHPGEVAPALPGSVGPGLPYAALFVGNSTLGFFQVFPSNAANGLGSPNPPTSLSVNRSISDLFGQPIADGTVLMFRINDINTGDNSGALRVGPATSVPSVPEPFTLGLLGLGLGVIGLRRRPDRQSP